MIFTSLRFERLILFAYFLGLIVLGSIFLMLPFAWKSPGSVGFLDALFTSVSAVCVTGLITVDTANYTRFGQIIIMLLIQLGGLGIITFTTMFLLQPVRKRKMSLRNAQVVQKFALNSVAYNPKDIILHIILFTAIIEGIGVVLLLPGFIAQGVKNPFFVSLFHGISAFCNAGFSTFSTGLEAFRTDYSLLVPIMALIILGGIGFLVLIDIRQYLRFSRQGTERRIKRGLSLYTKIVLIGTGSLILVGTLAYWGSGSGLSLFDSLFQSVTTRTAGFNTVSQSDLSNAGLVTTYPLMFIGGASGSTAGGIKISTFFLAMLVVFKGFNRKHQLQIFKRSIRIEAMHEALILMLKTLTFVFGTILLLTVVEQGMELKDLVFEALSAMGTVGLTRGVTPHLSSFGKIIIMITMFVGRVGLVSMIMIPSDPKDRIVYYPEEEVMIG